MNNLNVVGVDLAKNIIQVSVVTPAGKELQNKALTRKKFSEFLARQKPSLVAFESCATAHYWSRIAHTAWSYWPGSFQPRLCYTLQARAQDRFKRCIGCCRSGKPSKHQRSPDEDSGATRHTGNPAITGTSGP